MKRIGFLLLMMFIAVPLFAAERDRTPVPTLIDDVIRMSKAGVGEEAIIEFVRKSNERVDVTADDLIALTDAQVSKNVIRAVIDLADERDGRSRSRSRTRVIVEPRYAYSPYWGWGDPFYDPFWYGPRLSFGFGFGYPYGYGGRVFYRGGRGGRHRRH
jgi:hypothetical protein